jgi:hypothetical protein
MTIPLTILKKHLFWFGEQWEWESEDDRKTELEEKEDEDGRNSEIG